MIRLEPYFRFDDDRGAFLGISQGSAWREANMVETRKGMTRGGHYHKHTSELFFILEGAVKIDLLDIRTGEERQLTAEKGEIFIVEPGEVHTFCALTDAVWINMLSQPMDQNDPDVFEPEIPHKSKAEGAQPK